MEPMGWGDFLVVFACCAVTMLVCRTVPLFALKGRQLPEGVERALGFIPPAAFAALVANDLLTPGMFDAGRRPASGCRRRGARGMEDEVASVVRRVGRGRLCAALACVRRRGPARRPPPGTSCALRPGCGSAVPAVKR